MAVDNLKFGAKFLRRVLGRTRGLTQFKYEGYALELNQGMIQSQSYEIEGPFSGINKNLSGFISKNFKAKKEVSDVIAISLSTSVLVDVLYSGFLYAYDSSSISGDEQKNVDDILPKFLDKDNRFITLSSYYRACEGGQPSAQNLVSEARRTMRFAALNTMLRSVFSLICKVGEAIYPVLKQRLKLYTYIAINTIGLIYLTVRMLFLPPKEIVSEIDSGNTGLLNDALSKIRQYKKNAVYSSSLFNVLSKIETRMLKMHQLCLFYNAHQDGQDLHRFKRIKGISHPLIKAYFDAEPEDDERRDQVLLWIKTFVGQEQVHSFVSAECKQFKSYRLYFRVAVEFCASIVREILSEYNMLRIIAITLLFSVFSQFAMPYAMVGLVLCMILLEMLPQYADAQDYIWECLQRLYLSIGLRLAIIDSILGVENDKIQDEKQCVFETIQQCSSKEFRNVGLNIINEGNIGETVKPESGMSLSDHVTSTLSFGTATLG